MRTCRRRTRSSSICLIVLASVLVSPPGAEAFTCGAWEKIASPNPSSRSQSLASVDALAHTAFAVGWYRTPFDDIAPLILRWNGITWRKMQEPVSLDGYSDVRLVDVSARSTRDVWAVGNIEVERFSIQRSLSLMLHWDGDTWTHVPSPTQRDESFEMTAIDAVPGSSQVWAVGIRRDPIDRIPRSLAMLFDGTEWHTVRTPNPGAHVNELHDVVARSESDVSVAGGSTFPLTGVTSPWVMRRNGSHWKRSFTENFGDDASTAYGLEVLSDDAAWLVGDAGEAGMVQRWDGREWAVAATPDPTADPDPLYDVYAAATDDVWAVGGDREASVVHGTGAGWSVVDAPSPGHGFTYLSGVDGTDASNIWAVGQADRPARLETLTLHLC